MICHKGVYYKAIKRKKIHQGYKVGMMLSTRKPFVRPEPKGKRR